MRTDVSALNSLNSSSFWSPSLWMIYFSALIISAGLFIFTDLLFSVSHESVCVSVASRFDFYCFLEYEFLISTITFPLVTMLIIDMNNSVFTS